MTCYLFPVPVAKRPPASDLHETGGLPGNWALDYLAPAGALVLSPIDGKVTRWSGHDPKLGELPGAVFGWTLYLEGEGLAPVFVTHLGRRLVTVGARLCRGEAIGHVGAWPNDPPRSHCHLGVTSSSVQASKNAALAIGAALRLGPVALV